MSVDWHTSSSTDRSYFLSDRSQLMKTGGHVSDIPQVAQRGVKSCQIYISRCTKRAQVLSDTYLKVHKEGSGPVRYISQGSQEGSGPVRHISQGPQRGVRSCQKAAGLLRLLLCCCHSLSVIPTAGWGWSKHHWITGWHTLLTLPILWDCYIYILRVPDQNGVSQAWYIVEIHHSGR